MIGLDTTAIIDLFKNEENVKKKIGEFDEEIFSTQLNFQEIMFGLDLRREEYRKEKEYYDAFFGELNYLKLTDESIVKASEIFWGKNKEIGRVDSIIAAIFLSNGVDKILTKNVKHFEDIRGLKVISY